MQQQTSEQFVKPELKLFELSDRKRWQAKPDFDGAFIVKFSQFTQVCVCVCAEGSALVRHAGVTWSAVKGRQVVAVVSCLLLICSGEDPAPQRNPL